MAILAEGLHYGIVDEITNRPMRTQEGKWQFDVLVMSGAMKAHWLSIGQPELSVGNHVVIEVAHETIDKTTYPRVKTLYKKLFPIA